MPLAMQNTFGPAKDELMRLLRRYDQYGNGRVLYSDFVGACKAAEIDHNDASHDYIHRNFVVRGYVDITKLEAILDKVDVTLRPSLGAASPGSVTDASLKQLHDLVVTKLYARHEHLADAFLALDGNRDGSLSYLEFAQGLTSMGIDISEPEITALMRQHDARGCGRVDYEEFARFVQEPLTWALPEHVEFPDRLVAKLFPARDLLLDAFIREDTNYSQTLLVTQFLDIVDRVLGSVPLAEPELEFVLDHFSAGAADTTTTPSSTAGGDTENNPENLLIWYLPFVRHVATRGRELLSPEASGSSTARAMSRLVPEGAAAPHVLHPDVHAGVGVLDSLREIVYEAHAHMADAFVEMDHNRDGMIGLDDVLSVLAHHYITPTPDQIAEIAAMFGQGSHVDYAAFAEFLGQEDPVAREEAAAHMAVFEDLDETDGEGNRVFDSAVVKSTVAKLYVPGKRLLTTLVEYSDSDQLALPALRQALHRLHVRLNHDEFEWVCSKFGSLGDEGVVDSVNIPQLVHFVTHKGAEGLKYGGH